jgi:hypothetical protein
MTLEELKATLAQPAPPAGVSKTVEALWYAAKGQWDTAHGIVQGLNDADAAWVHAYLHREEGDNANAGYWYRRANRPPSGDSLEEEWRQIAAALLA